MIWTRSSDNCWVAESSQGKLGSHRFPRSEAERWVASQGDLQFFPEVYIFGIGHGAHLFEISRIYPQLSVCAISSMWPEIFQTAPAAHQEALLGLRQFKFFDSPSPQTIPRGPLLYFRPAMSRLDFENLERFLAQQDEKFHEMAVRHSFSELSRFLNPGAENFAVNIQRLVPQGGSREAKLSYVLKELVK